MATASAVPAAPTKGESRTALGLVVLIVLVALLAGWGIKVLTQGRTTQVVAGGGSVEVAYPGGWAQSSSLSGDTVLDVYDPGSNAPFPTRFRVAARPAAATAALVDLATVATLNRSRALREYRELSNREMLVSGQPAIQVSYGYVADPPAAAGPAILPIVVQGTDTLMLYNGKLYTFTGLSQAGAAGEAAAQGKLTAILDSVRLK